MKPPDARARIDTQSHEHPLDMKQQSLHLAAPVPQSGVQIACRRVRIQGSGFRVQGSGFQQRGSVDRELFFLLPYEEENKSIHALQSEIAVTRGSITRPFQHMKTLLSINYTHLAVGDRHDEGLNQKSQH